MRPILIAVAITIAALVVAMTIGFQQSPEIPAEIGTALRCELIEGQMACWESP